MVRNFVAARLRKRRDMDIIQAISGVEEGELSDLVRSGLRLVLNKVKQPEQKQKPQPKTLDWGRLK